MEEARRITGTKEFEEISRKRYKNIIKKKELN